jgi:hypothetical protein
MLQLIYKKKFGFFNGDLQITSSSNVKHSKNGIRMQAEDV